ncbi:hypothetical protein ACQKRQ_26865 [Paraburkholderia sp. NPDC080076]|uniref:hypothetical protein n=1 Tax=Paraburkholderia sp. NPDC080076 TaxID=3390605 RepID=UPI003D0402BC
MTDFTIDVDTRQWASKPVSRLPHFSRLRQIIERLAGPTQARILYTHEELESEFGTGRFDGSELFRPLRALFDEIAAIRRLDEFFNLKVALPADITDVMLRQCDMTWLLDLINLETSGEMEVNFYTASGQATPLKAMLAAPPEPMTFVHHVDLEIYGCSYGPFDVEVSCPAVGVHVVGPANIEAGATVELAMRAVEGHQWTPRLIGRTSERTTA